MDAELQRRVQCYGWNEASTLYERFWADGLDNPQAGGHHQKRPPTLLR